MISRQKLQFSWALGAIAIITVSSVNALAQQASVAKVGQLHTSATPSVRVVKKVDNASRVKLAGHLSPALAHAKDLGRLAPGTKAESLVLVLSSSDEQKAELHRVLDQQQDKNSPNFHQWVTPEQFGEHFGAADADIAKVSGWLQSQGFTVNDVSKSKRVLHFSGTTGQLEQAFATEMHSFQVDGENHVANNSEISVPEALKPVIAGVTLNDFFRKGHMVNKRSVSKAEMLSPDWSVSSNSVHYVGPWDFATIYNTFPLLNKGINGAGTSIAVVGRSDILLSDVQNYRSLFNLPNNDPIFIHAGRDNGIQPGDDGESDLDVEISGGIAPMSQVYFVIGTPTFLVDGITNSVEYIVENNVADIVSISYGSCESTEGVGGNEFNNQAFEQGAAQGMSIFIAAGDNGPAECDNQNDSWEVYGYSTGGESSTPYSVSVGGTQGYETGTITNYWNATTQSTPPYYGLSAVNYYAEVPWNESKNADKSLDSSGLAGLWSGSGGISSYYIQPSWQRGSGVYTTDPAYANGGNWVTNLTITNAGAGYTTTPTVTATGGGCTAEPTIIATMSGGSITALTFQQFNSSGTEKTGQGFGCTSAPSIAIGAPTSGTTATASAAIGPMVNTPALVSGVPHRYTPDLALNAASGHDATIFCSEGQCANGYLGLVGGTSVAAPSMAGIQALINQANGGRQGMPGFIYYALSAAQTEANCNSANAPANSTSTCAFRDITLGDNLICGTSGCSTSPAKMGWSAGTGYDLASGLGSPNAYNLATQWSSVVFNSTATTLGLSQTSGISQGTPVTISGTVAPSFGSGTPTGDVAFILSSGSVGQTLDISGDANNGAFNGHTAFATLSNGSYSATLSNLPGGSYTVTARYAGDGTYASSLSTPVPISVNQGGATITITPATINLLTCATPTATSTFSYGSPVYATINVASANGSGVPTGNVNITVDGMAWGTQPLDPNGNAYMMVGNYGTASTSCLYDYIFSQGAFLTGGQHQIGVSYAGDSTFPATNATPATVTITPLSVTPTLAVGAQTITTGFTVPLNATFSVAALTSGSPTTATGPTGTVTFTDTTTSTVLGTATVVPTVAFSVTASSTSSYPSYTFGATASGSTNLITTSGANSVTVSYSGDANYAATTSTPSTVTVGSGQTATSTAVTSSANPTTLNGRPTLTATVSTVTSGTVSFYDSGVLLGTGTVGSTHTATYKPATTYPLVGGSHFITAVYGGITASAPSTSPVFTQTVTKGTNAIAMQIKPAGLSGQSFTLAAVLTPSTTSAVYTPTLANVMFYDGSTLLGSAPALDFNAAQGGQGDWTATLTVSGLAPGTHSITAQYSDTNYSLTSSTAQVLAVLTSVPGRIWTANGNATTTYIGTTGTLATMGTAGSASTLGGVALDASGSAWWTASGNNNLYFASTTGAAPSTYTGGGLSAPAAVAVDGAGYVWVANSNAGTVSAFTNAGVALTGSPAYGATANNAASSSQGGTGSVAIDNTGGVWVTNQTGNSVTHIVGAAAPVKPLSTAVTAGTLGAKP